MSWHLVKHFFTKKVEKLANVPGYHLCSNCCTEYKGGGVCFFFRNGIRASRRKDLETFIEKEVETIYIEITSKCGKR